MTRHRRAGLSTYAGRASFKCCSRIVRETLTKKKLFSVPKFRSLCTASHPTSGDESLVPNAHKRTHKSILHRYRELEWYVSV